MNDEAAFMRAFDVINTISKICVIQIVEVKKKINSPHIKIQVSPCLLWLQHVYHFLSAMNATEYTTIRNATFMAKTPFNSKTHKHYMYIQKTLNYNTCTQHKYGWTWNRVIFYSTQLQLKNITTESLQRTDKYLSW